MRILIKIGGSQLEQPDSRQELCRAVQAAREQGNEVIVVHGGGNQIRTIGKAMGLEDRYHEGLRITDAQTAQTVLMVLGGLVNRTLVAALQRADVPAVGLTGADGNTFTAKPLVHEDVDLGFVGSVDAVDSRLVETLLASGNVPVLATVAPDGDEPKDGALAVEQPFYNINADHAAGPLCRAFGCDALLFLTDVKGVLDAEQRLMPLLSKHDCDRLIQSGVATAGMRPKLESAYRAAAENPHAIVKIASANQPDCVLAALRDGVGTRFFHARGAATGGESKASGDGRTKSSTTGSELQHG